MLNHKHNNACFKLFFITLLLYSATGFALTCSVTTTPMSFGSYDVFSATPNDTSSTVTVTCDISAPFTLTMNAGTTAGATISNRRLAYNTQILNYNIFTDASRTTTWGDGVTGASVSGTGVPGGTAVIAYASLNARQNVTAGNYSDNVTVTVTY